MNVDQALLIVAVLGDERERVKAELRSVEDRLVGAIGVAVEVGASWSAIGKATGNNKGTIHKWYESRTKT